jgi:hypothetical protein
MKDFTQMNESQTMPALDALNKEIQRKDAQIDWLQKQATFSRQVIQQMSGHTNEAQFDCNTCG